MRKYSSAITLVDKEGVLKPLLLTALQPCAASGEYILGSRRCHAAKCAPGGMFAFPTGGAYQGQSPRVTGRFEHRHGGCGGVGGVN